MTIEKCRNASRIGRAGTVDLVPSTAESLDAIVIASSANEIRFSAQGAQHVFILFDASIISREDAMFYAAWWPARAGDGWLPPITRAEQPPAQE